jgi:hypothetical protein
MAFNLDNKNRYINISNGSTPDGQRSVKIMYDLYTRNTFFIDDQGVWKNMDGTTYTPPTLPYNNRVIGYTYSLSEDQFINPVPDEDGYLNYYWGGTVSGTLDLTFDATFPSNSVDLYSSSSGVIDTNSSSVDTGNSHIVFSSGIAWEANNTITISEVDNDAGDVVSNYQYVVTGGARGGLSNPVKYIDLSQFVTSFTSSNKTDNGPGDVCATCTVDVITITGFLSVYSIDDITAAGDINSSIFQDDAGYEDIGWITVVGDGKTDFVASGNNLKVYRYKSSQVTPGDYTLTWNGPSNIETSCTFSVTNW